MSFFKSEIVQDNLQDIFETYKGIAAMSSELPHMDKHGRIQHINDTLMLVEKQKVFYTRLVLASMTDEEAKDMKVRIDSLTNAFGYANLTECMDGMFAILNDALQRELETDT
ncbi:DUF1825 domain-containing protein [Synechococcus phage S-ShM2]|uniref:DUF1825 domain-containing protein n=3 Tax=Ahtivirus sagseatwo TaxID=2734079 RepID=A0A1D7SM66_9CAUD|nr:DUF1825 domain-containing protein [Synechococcus phage S-ShM2]AGH57337.1 hypothetical protein CPLG_00083 [Cyanophage S-SSM2]AOO13116.1 hypothetical protein LIS021110_002 [Cyanophage S-RIM14]ADO97613.1 DUF1825 domain-containing protein [Synechococcus phage S-ShM2]AOO13332.1 hypothetical protein LIS110610_002 [Cyanophage S-RIM14]AOO13548.1 hypothetical protein Np111211_002 [Cyanophage S-RIM14]